MKSTRLPGKALLELAGRPMLWHVAERVKASLKVDQVVVATTSNPEDLAIELFCKEQNIACVRGSVEDVLDRVYQAAHEFPGDIIVRIPADKPLVDPALIDQCIEELERGGYDFVSNVHPPEANEVFLQGIGIEAFRFSALEKAHRSATRDYERAHATPYIWENRNNEFKILKVAVPQEYMRNHRLTVDYPEDFELIKKIYEVFYKPGALIYVPDVLVYLDEHPVLAKINGHCEQKAVTAL